MKVYLAERMHGKQSAGYETTFPHQVSRNPFDSLEDVAEAVLTTTAMHSARQNWLSSVDEYIVFPYEGSSPDPTRFEYTKPAKKNTISELAKILNNKELNEIARQAMKETRIHGEVNTVLDEAIAKLREMLKR